jgi:acyl-CoA synthetase (AMP-forming)/AMP-acid ligase II
MTTDPRTVPAALDRFALRLPDHHGMGQFLGHHRVADLDRLHNQALPALRHIARIPVDADDGTWDELMAGGPESGESLAPDLATRAAGVEPDDVSDIPFTSGTTRRSKGVLCAHRRSRLVDALPRNAGGKVVKSQLREQD